MKKIFLMLVAMGLIMSSCQKDENLGATGGETLVTVTASVPQAVGVRAVAAYTDSALGGVKNIADADYDLRFILKIYEGDTVVKEDQWTDEIAALTHQKQYRLVPGHNYTFVIWADIVAEGTDTDLYYNTTAFPEIAEVAGKHAINEEARDAYFVTKTIAVEENANIDLTLKRPFGKVRVVTTDWAEDAVQNGGAPTEVTITYNDVDVYSGINIKSGALLASTKATNAYTADINNYSTDAEGEKTLYVDYIWGLPATEGATAATVEQYPIHFTIATAIRTYEVKADVPVTRNWLTTVKGNILTTNTNININVDPNSGNNHEVEAWDGSTKPATEENGVYTITTATQLAWVAEQVNSGANTFSGKTVKLADNIDLNNVAWTPIGLNADNSKKFYGTFDGQDKTISNLSINLATGYTAAGLFGALNGTAKNFTIKGATVKHISSGDPTSNGIAVVAGSIYTKGTIDNVHVENATVEGNRYMGGISGYTYGNVTNCSVKNIKLTATPDTEGGSYNNGDKVGAVVGYWAGESTYVITGNTATEFEIKGYRDLGGIVGSAASGKVADNHAENGKILIDQQTGYYGDKDTNAGAVIGRNNGGLTESNNTSENVEIAQGVGTIEALQKVLDKVSGNIVISLTNDLAGDVTVTEKQDITITINGNSNKYDGQIAIYGNSSDTNSTLILKNINFETSTADQVFIYAFNTAAGDNSRYADNVTVENCTFTAVAGSAAEHTAVGAKFAQALGAIKITGCTATNMHSLMQAESCGVTAGVSVEGATVINGKNGVSFNNTKVAKISNSTITATGDGSYGVRVKGERAGYGLTVSNCTISAFVPVLVRNMTATSYTATLEGNNTLTASGANPYQVVFCNVDYDGTAALVAPTGTYTVTGADNFNVYPNVDNKPLTANSTEQVDAIIGSGATNIKLAAGSYTIPNSAQGKTVSFVGTGNPEDVVITSRKVGTGYENCDYGLDGSDATFEGVTIATNSSTYIGYARCNGTYKNCIINGTYTLYGKSVFEDCVFNVSGDVYNIWTWGAKEMKFTRCTFNSDGKALLLYQEGTNTVNLTVENCVFNDKGGLTSKKAAIEIGDAPYGATPTYNVTVSGTTVNGYEINNEGINTGTTLWGNKNSMPDNRLNVTVDGVDVY